jgi:hypothetical protein
MGGSALLLLEDELHGIGRQNFANLVRSVTDDHQRPFDAQAVAQIQDVPHHRQPAQRVHNLRKIGAHSRSLTGSDDDGAGFLGRKGAIDPGLGHDGLRLRGKN